MNYVNYDRLLPFKCQYCENGFQTNDSSIFLKDKFTPREELVFLATMSKYSHRYNEMVCYITRVAELGKGLSLEEREMFSEAYQKLITTRQQSLQVINQQFRNEINSGNVTCAFGIKCLKETIEAEIRAVCVDVLNTLEKIFKQPRDGLFGANGVFYYKMKGDYHRYLAEYSMGNFRLAAIDNSKAAYKAATSISFSELSPIDPLRLCLILNVGTFYHDILGNTATAKRLVRSALKYALAIFLPEFDRKSIEPMFSMRKLRDCYMAWSLIVMDPQDLSFVTHEVFRVSPDHESPNSRGGNP